MRTKLLFLIALSTMLFLGCSVDPLDEPNMTTINDNTERSVKPTPISFKSSGVITVMEDRMCEPYLYLDMNGILVSEAFGKMRVSMTNCTDFRTVHFIKGSYEDGNGDKMFFYSEVSGYDENGNWHLYVFDGGTGRYMNLSGKLKVYDHIELQNEKEGIFIQHAEGILSF